MSTEPTKSNAATNTFTECSLQNPHNFTVGCTVQYGKPTKYGVIKWIGKFPDNKKTIYAGLVMVRLHMYVFYMYVLLGMLRKTLEYYVFILNGLVTCDICIVLVLDQCIHTILPIYLHSLLKC